MVTDKEINLDRIVFYNCISLTDKSFSKIKNVKSIDITNNPHIGKDVYKLDMEVLYLEKCPNVSSAFLQNLPPLKHLALVECENITDEGVCCLDSKTIHIVSCELVTNESIKVLAEKIASDQKDQLITDTIQVNKMKQLYVGRCPKVTEECIDNLQQKYVNVYHTS